MPTEPEVSEEPPAVEEEPEPAPAPSTAWGIDPTTVNVSALESRFGDESKTLAQDVLRTLEIGYLESTEIHVPRTPLAPGSIEGANDAPYREAMLPHLTEAFTPRFLDGTLATGERIAELLVLAVDADGWLFDYDGVTYHATSEPVALSMPFAPLVSLAEDWALVDATVVMSFPTAEGPTVTATRIVTLMMTPGEDHWLVDNATYQTPSVEVS